MLEKLRQELLDIDVEILKMISSQLQFLSDANQHKLDYMYRVAELGFAVRQRKLSLIEVY